MLKGYKRFQSFWTNLLVVAVLKLHKCIKYELVRLSALIKNCLSYFKSSKDILLPNIYCLSKIETIYLLIVLESLCYGNPENIWGSAATYTLWSINHLYCLFFQFSFSFQLVKIPFLSCLNYFFFQAWNLEISPTLKRDRNLLNLEGFKEPSEVLCNFKLL